MHFLVPHLLCILHKVDDNPGDSDDAEEGDADARDDEREHDRGVEAKLKLGHNLCRMLFCCSGGSSLFSWDASALPISRICFVTGGVVIGPFQARF